jgi:hypothetical protein
VTKTKKCAAFLCPRDHVDPDRARIDVVASSRNCGTDGDGIVPIKLTQIPSMLLDCCHSHTV